MARLSAVATVERDRVVPVLHHDDVDDVVRVAEILFSYGFTTLEFTNRSETAASTFERIFPRLSDDLPGLTLGAGSIGSSEAASMFIDNGARFVVGPATSEAVASVCFERGIPYMPGCGTLTEILRGHEMGCEIVKLFPASVIGGPPFLEAVRAPCPDIKVMPTGGVDFTAESLESWFRAGAVAVGLGSALIPASMLASKDWSGIESKVGAVADNLARALARLES
jgi:2-dehydro-3-deoxyphosphogluconate aldolase/(4S)-4-hydroxy-2-oxoglutarate aldolase